MRDLTIGEQRRLAVMLRAQNPLLYSFDIAPVDVNILPMGLVVDTDTVNRCVAALADFGERNMARTHGMSLTDPTYAHEIVVAVLKAAAMDVERGSTEHGESETGGPTPGASSGADHD